MLSCNFIYQGRFYLFLLFNIAPEHAFRAHTAGFVELTKTLELTHSDLNDDIEEKDSLLLSVGKCSVVQK